MFEGPTRSIVAVCFLLVAPLAIARDSTTPRILHTELTPHGYLFVVEENGLRILRFGEIDGADQSMIDPGDPEAVPMDYIRVALVGLAFLERAPRRVLMIGLGGGSYTNFLWRKYPEARIEVIEINEAVVRVARRYFDVPQDERYRIRLADGRDWIEKSKSKYDLIFVDAYGDADDIPEGLADAGFFRLVKGHLAPGGVAVVNLSVERGREKTVRRRFEKVFGRAAGFSTPEDNFVVVGRKDGTVPAIAALAKRASEIMVKRKIGIDLCEIATWMEDVR